MIRIRDGWPFTHPYLIVRGISSEHTNAAGVVCLWRDDDQSREWMTWDGFIDRAAEWCRLASTGGFRPVDLGLDAYVGFEDCDPHCLATFDLKVLLNGPLQDGKHQRIHAVRRHQWLIELRPAKATETELEARLFYREGLPAPPRTRRVRSGTYAVPTGAIPR